MSEPLQPEQKYKNAGWLVLENKPGPRPPFQPEKPMFIFFNKKQADDYVFEHNLKRAVKGRCLLKIIPITINMPYSYTDHKNQLEIF